ncbi:MAG TPA: formimidoylglutamate deiminase [Bryobacteraceae bacterium]|nr:formimidoylglutamate deiminase [Bryobacteraceae bacterium]
MTGWLPDYIWKEGAFESGVAMFADSSGRITHFSSAPADLAQAERLAGRAMLPGLVNAHSHAFQRVIRGRTEQRTGSERDTFWTWRQAMYRAANLLSPEALYHAARMAFVEMLLSGVTTVGEFHYLHHDAAGQPYEDRNLLALEILRAAEDTGLRIALLRAAYLRGGQPRFLTPRLNDFIADTETLSAQCKPGRSWLGLAPHSIRAVPLDYLLELVRYARAKTLPVHMHVAEQPAEVETCIAEYGMPPVTLLHQHGILDDRFTAIHAIHVTEQEIDQLGAARSMVCACPTTERSLGDGICPADHFLRCGVRIALGSDSNVQIDLFEDARELEYHLRLQRLERVVLDPDRLAAHLLACATENGAASLAAPSGKLEVGRPADFFTVDLNDPSVAGADPESLASNIVFSLGRTAVRDVYVDGKCIVRGGHHALEQQILNNFADVQRSLWNSQRIC